jgi:hypothetical protein
MAPLLQAQSSKRELLSRGLGELPAAEPPAAAAGPSVLGPDPVDDGGATGLKSASLIGSRLPLGRDGPLMGEPWGMALLGLDPWGMAPEPRRADSLVPGVDSPAGERRVERGMPSLVALGRLPRRNSGPSAASRRRAPKSLAADAELRPPAL